MVQKIRYFRKPYRIKRKKSILKSRFFRLGILILIFLLSIFYFLFFSEIFQVEKIIVTGEEKVSSDDIKLLVEKKIEKKLLFFKTKSIFLVDFNEIRKDILNNFSQIAEVEIGRGFPDSLNIVVIERLGLAIWCQNSSLPEEAPSPECFLLDKEGIIFEELKEIEKLSDIESRTLKIQNLNLKEDLKLGKKIIESELLSKILEIESKLRDYNPPTTLPLGQAPDLKISVAEILIISEERLNIRTSEGWEIYFNPKENINWQLTELNLILKERIPPEKRQDLEYIDLRFNRVYFKYK